VLVITGEGLKTLDAVRGTFATHTIGPTVEEFEAKVPAPAAAQSSHATV
jgi:threonine synthase